MSDFPTEEEEYELMYADELDLLREIDEPIVRAPVNKIAPPQVSTEATNSTILNGTSNETPAKEKSFKRQLFEDDDYHLRSPKRRNLNNDDTDDFPALVIDESEEPLKKRRINDDSEDMEEAENMISRIQTQRQISASQNFSEESRMRVERSGKLLRKVPSENFVSITHSSGSRGYLRVMDTEADIAKRESTSGQNRLLSVPFSSLKEAALLHLMQKQKKTEEQIAAQEALSEASDSGIDTEDEGDSDVLWVDKYRPNQYLELLSDDGTNRVLLTWLKLWDKLVFDKEKKERRKNKAKDDKPGFKAKILPEVNVELDSAGRPVQKVALLCGPPGLGKTTLGHVIAKHAGYNVVEMNASDDRSPEAFVNQLEAATQMRSVMGNAPRPNCLIIDEIDGAPGQSINLLVNVLNGKTTTRGKAKKKGGEAQQGLRRPLICICNDLYTPALRPLRQIALVVHFPPTQPARLASRLLAISKRQKVKTDMATCLALCEKAEMDIRSCLSTLEFASHRGGMLRMRDVQAARVGQKDAHKSLFQVWQNIFTMPRPKKKHVEHRLPSDTEKRPYIEEDPDNNLAPPVRFKNILEIAMACGDYEKAFSGLHENFLNMKFKDSRMENVCLGMEWLAWSDLLQKEIYQSQSYTLMGYLPYLCVMFHFLFASLQYGKLQYPAAQNEMNSKISKTTSVLTMITNEMSAQMRSSVCVTSLMMDLLPSLCHIIRPQLRAVNMQLYSPKEKEQLQQLINIMISFNLTYRQERTPEGQYTYCLDPNIEEVVRFSDSKCPTQMTYAIKQLIAREIELERMRQSDTAVPAAKTEPKPPETTPQPAAVPNHKQSLKPMQVKQEKGPVDFFGRALPRKEETSVEEKTAQGSSFGDIWFHFKEGYNNAVRRNVKIAQFL